MSFMTSPVALRGRDVLRKLGVVRALQSYMGATGAAYEVRFRDAMRASMRPGSTIWDVGAHTGHYSEQFAEWVGLAGHVYGFEPNPDPISRFSKTCVARPNFTLVPVGMSDKSGTATFKLEGGLSRIGGGAETDGDVVSLEVVKGDDLVTQGKAPVPDAIKVDVEGHELAALTGMGVTLDNPKVRDVFVEVHFGLLHGTGRGDHPKKIEQFMEGKGFKLAWVDRSHLHASR